MTAIARQLDSNFRTLINRKRYPKSKSIIKKTGNYENKNTQIYNTSININTETSTDRKIKIA